MNLKSAFRFQNWLDALMTEAQERVKNQQDFYRMAKVMLYLLEEKEKIYTACSNAKQKLDIDIDVQKTVNNKRYNVAKFVNYCGIKGNHEDLILEAKKLTDKSTQCSDKIEMAILSQTVDYEEPFPFETSLDDVVELLKL